MNAANVGPLDIDPPTGASSERVFLGGEFRSEPTIVRSIDSANEDCLSKTGIPGGRRATGLTAREASGVKRAVALGSASRFSRVAAIMAVSLLVLTVAAGCGKKAAPTHTSNAAKVVVHPKFKDVSAIFHQYCAQCHIGTTSGGLSLATYDSVMKGGQAGKVIEPGKPDQSLLWLAINGKPNPANIPPMPFGMQPIPDNAKQTIENWITDGAPQS